MTIEQLIIKHQQKLHRCRQCPDMIPPIIQGEPVASPVMLIGQAPGIREEQLQRPFAWTAGKTLFKWFASIGMEEEDFRRNVYISAVCRCFPGKKPEGGDRVPNKKEISNCSQWLNAELNMLHPGLIIPVGKLAISQFLSFGKLVDVIGQSFRQKVDGVETLVIPLPHPSGASTWHQRPPGKILLQQALLLIQAQPVWQAL